MTKQFTAFDKAACIRLRAELQEVLGRYGAETGITFDVGNMKFTSENVSIKVEAKKPGAVSQRDMKLETALKRNAAFAGLTLDEVNGRQLVGYNSRAHKMPWIYLEKSTGKRYKCSTYSAQVHFGKQSSRAA